MHLSPLRRMRSRHQRPRRGDGSVVADAGIDEAVGEVDDQIRGDDDEAVPEVGESRGRALFVHEWAVTAPDSQSIPRFKTLFSHSH